MYIIPIAIIHLALLGLLIYSNVPDERAAIALIVALAGVLVIFRLAAWASPKRGRVIRIDEWRRR